MQSVSSRIRTRVAVSISYDDNHYTTGTSNEGVLTPPSSSGWCHTQDTLYGVGVSFLSICRRYSQPVINLTDKLLNLSLNKGASFDSLWVLHYFSHYFSPRAKLSKWQLIFWNKESSNLLSFFFAWRWHKAEWMRHPMRLELTLAGLPGKLANH